MAASPAFEVPAEPPLHDTRSGASARNAASPADNPHPAAAGRLALPDGGLPGGVSGDRGAGPVDGWGIGISGMRWRDADTV